MPAHRAPHRHPAFAGSAAKPDNGRLCLPPRARHVQDPVHADRRSAVPGHRQLPADRAGLRKDRGRGRGDPRHLAGGAHPGPVQRHAAGRPAGGGRPARTRRAGEDAGRQHHQAAQHQRLGAAAEGRDRRAAGQGPGAAGLPGRAAGRAREGHQAALRAGNGQRGQPGAARGQFRPPRAEGGEGVRAQAPAPDGQVGRGVRLARRAHGRRRLRGPVPLQRAR